MKSIFTSILFVLIAVGGFSQTYFATFNGYVTDCAGNPVAGHPVYIVSDSTTGTMYYNTVYTDSLGYYWDTTTYASFFGSTLFIVGTTDTPPGTGYYYANITATGGGTFSNDFSIACDSSSGGGGTCAGSFIPYIDSTGSSDTLYLICNYTSASPSTTTITWDYGDGTTGTGLITVHDYAAFGTYYVCMTISDVSDSCSFTYCDSVLYVVRASGAFTMKTVTAVVLSTPEYFVNDVKVFPNPANDLISLTGTSLDKVSSIVIRDLSGRVVQTEQLKNIVSNIQLSINQLDKGSYLLTLYDELNTPLHTHTLIKN